MPMVEPFTEPPELIRRRAKRFEIAMWFFLATISLGLGHTLFLGSSFFPALRQAQFQYAELDIADNVAGIVPFVNAVIATWPERLAAFPATRKDVAAILLAFVLGTAAFLVVIRPPKGDPLLETYPDPERQRRLVRCALELANSNVLLFKRTDGGKSAEYCRKQNAIYLPADFAQVLERKHSDNAAEQLAFLILHEKAHDSTSDNFLWSWGRSLAFLLTGVSATLIATPIMFAAAAVFPAELAQILPFPLSLGLLFLFSLALLGFIGAVTHGVLPNLAAAREFFADTLATRTLDISPQSLPYKGSTDIASRGDIGAGWSMNTSGPDRALHAKGIAPRTGALAASALPMWMLVRTLILMLDPTARYGMVWLFDAAYLIAIAVMLHNLPRHRAGTRDYGFLPWAATIILVGIISASFALIDEACRIYGIATIMPPSWLATIAVPPVVVTAAALLYYRAASVPHKDIQDIDRLPPRFPGIGPAARLVAAVPSYIWSYTVAGLALLTWCTTLASWGSGDFSATQQYFVFDAVSLPVCALFALLVVKNFREPRPWSAACEAGAGVIVLALFIYTDVCMILAAAQAPPPNSGPPFDMSLFTQIFLSPPPYVVTTTLIITAIAGLLLTASWEFRYRYLTEESLFASLKRRAKKPDNLPPS